MRVDVTREDIALGCKAETMECPVARAVSRAAGYPASVTHGTIYLFEDAGAVTSDDWHDHVLKKWVTPEVVVMRIRLYDAGLGMSPFSFEL